MSAVLRIEAVSPLTSIQDRGRFGMLAHGVGASGPMDRAGFAAAAHALGGAGRAGIEFTRNGIALALAAGACRIGFAGGRFRASLNGAGIAWPGAVALSAGDRLRIEPGGRANYGYLRFDMEIAGEPVLSSFSTNTRAGLGRVLAAGDELVLAPAASLDPGAPEPAPGDGPIRVLWGLHAATFAPGMRARFIAADFAVSPAMDRMGVRLADTEGVFAGGVSLSLVSDAVVAGDVQILGDGTPIVLMRDHQPTGGYPRIATVISADLDRFAQMRPGAALRFAPVTLEHAQTLARAGAYGQAS